MNNKIWLSSPHMGGGEKKFIESAFDTNWIAPLGPNVNDFEHDLSEYLDTPHVLSLSSGTAAMHLALMLLGVTCGDEVICQSLTFSASANPIAYLGALPVFVDSEKDTWNMSPAFLKAAIEDRIAKGKKPKAIIVVHLYGMPAKMEEIMAIAQSFDIPVVEDAAEALGSSINGKKCGTFGDLAILSFNGNKIITTSGGGALICNTAAQKQHALFLATQARDQAEHYQHSHIGYNYRMSNVLAGIGRGQMEVLPLRVDQRRAVNQRYKNELATITEFTFQTENMEGAHSNYWLTAATIDDTTDKHFSRKKLYDYLNTKNIESRPVWKPLHLQPIFESSPFYGDGTAEYLFDKGICIPSGSNLTTEELSFVINEILACYNNNN